MEKEKPYGFIYKITSPLLACVYIGKTIKSPHQRFKEHKSEALGKRKETKGNGALYEVMRAFGPDKFKVEILCGAYDEKELSEKEKHYMNKYDSVKNGLNRVQAAQIIKIKKGKIKILLDGNLKIFQSKAQMCRQLEISNSTLNHWLKKGLKFEDAVKNTLDTKKRILEKGFICFRKHYKTYTELAKDKKINRFGYTGREIATRVRKGMSVEKAISTKKRPKPPKIGINIKGQILYFKNIADAYRQLIKNYKLPVYSAIVQRLEKGESPEEAFGFKPRPWMNKFKKHMTLIDEKDYKLIGELKSWSIPIILKHTKEIFANKQIFAKTYGLEYTGTSKKIKNNVSPEEILILSGHIKSK